MKNYSLIVLAIIVWVGSVNAQKITIGGEFGVNSSRLTTDPDNFSSSARTGYQAGISMRLGNKVYLQPEFQWAWMSSELSNPLDFGSPTSDNLNVHSFRVPVQLGFAVVNGKVGNVRIFTGPVMNFNFKADNASSPVFNQEFKPFNVAARVGTGFDLWVLNVDLSYDIGVTDVFEGSDAKMRGFNAELGVAIPLK